MTIVLTRRRVGLGLSALLAAGAAPARAVTDDTIAAIERRRGGRLGLFVLDAGSGRTLAHRADERFLMCSTFKGVLAAMVLSNVDAGRDDLADLVSYRRSDLLEHSPVTSAHVGKGALPVATLCAAAVRFSDNAAANVLLRRAGGPAALTAYVRKLGDATTHFDNYEPVSTQRSGVRDTTTPRAFVATARAILVRDALRPKSRALLEGWMVACETGQSRLRASFPPAWRTGDKTGTADGACNDYAIVRRNGRAPLLIAAYHDAPGMDLAPQEEILRDVGSAVVTWAA